MKRLVQTQVCPVLRYLDAIAPCTAASTSASSNTIKGAIPPSSNARYLIVGAHCALRSRPTSVDPVNDSLRTRGLRVSSPPISLEDPVKTLNTPRGMPALWASSASASADKGVALAGFKTIVQPAARAGPALRVIMAFGK